MKGKLVQHVEFWARLFAWVFAIALAIRAVLELFPLETYELFNLPYVFLFLFIIASYIVLMFDLNHRFPKRSGENRM